MKTWEQFKIGDVVSRLGDDEHEIIGKNDIGDMIEVRCIKPDHNAVFAVGDTECNVAESYEFVRTPNAEAHGRAVARTVQPLVGNSGGGQ